MLRDRIRLIESLDKRGTPDEHVQPEAFAADPTEGPHQAPRHPPDAQPGPHHRGHRHRQHQRGRGGRLAGQVHRRPALQERLPAVPDQDRQGHRRLRDDRRGGPPALPVRPARRGTLARPDPHRRRPGPPARRRGRPQGHDRRGGRGGRDRGDAAHEDGLDRQTRGGHLPPGQHAAAEARRPTPRSASSCNTSATRPTASPSTTTTSSARRRCSTRADRQHS